MKVRINAILKTLTPLHIAAPGAFRLNTDTGYVEFESAGNKNSMTPCTGIQKLRVTGSNGNISMPVIAANNIAGRLRRHAAELVLKALRAKGQKVSIQAYSSLMCGAATGAPDSRDLSYAEYKQSADHPYLGLFGGGPRMLSRNVRVMNALPVSKETAALMENLTHPNARSYQQDVNRLTQAWTFRHNDDLMDLSNVPLQEESIENYVEAIQSRQVVIMNEKGNEDENGKKRSKTSTFAFSSLEFVIPGTHFDLAFNLDVANEAQIGLFLMSLDSFVSKERMGGHSRNGFGAFVLKDVVMTDEDGKETNIFDSNGRLNQMAGSVKPYLGAWAIAAANLDTKVIEEMMTMPTIEKKGKKAAKAEAE